MRGENNVKLEMVLETSFLLYSLNANRASKTMFTFSSIRPWLAEHRHKINLSQRVLVKFKATIKQAPVDNYSQP